MELEAELANVELRKAFEVRRERRAVNGVDIEVGDLDGGRAVRGLLVGPDLGWRIRWQAQGGRPFIAESHNWRPPSSSPLYTVQRARGRHSTRESAHIVIAQPMLTGTAQRHSTTTTVTTHGQYE